MGEPFKIINPAVKEFRGESYTNHGAARRIAEIECEREYERCEWIEGEKSSFAWFPSEASWKSTVLGSRPKGGITAPSELDKLRNRFTFTGATSAHGRSGRYSAHLEALRECQGFYFDCRETGSDDRPVFGTRVWVSGTCPKRTTTWAQLLRYLDLHTDDLKGKDSIRARETFIQDRLEQGGLFLLKPEANGIKPGLFGMRADVLAGPLLRSVITDASSLPVEIEFDPVVSDHQRLSHFAVLRFHTSSSFKPGPRDDETEAHWEFHQKQGNLEVLMGDALHFVEQDIPVRIVLTHLTFKDGKVCLKATFYKKKK